MAWRSGNKGTAYVSANKVLEVVGWSINKTATDIAAVSVDSDYTRHKAGSRDHQGTISVLHDPDDTTGQEAMSEGSEIELHLYADDKVASEQEYTSVGNGQGGKVVILSDGITSTVDGVTTREYAWAGQMLKAVVGA